jgi:hypothetical protein
LREGCEIHWAIADFRRDNGPAIRKVCARFVALCRDLHLLDGGSVAIDGAWMGATHFRMKTQKHVATDMGLHVVAYNPKRAMAIIGVPELVRGDLEALHPSRLLAARP